MGVFVGIVVELEFGDRVGTFVGVTVLLLDGAEVGTRDGKNVASFIGAVVGFLVAVVVGARVCVMMVGELVSFLVGAVVGSFVGVLVCFLVGALVVVEYSDGTDVVVGTPDEGLVIAGARVVEPPVIGTFVVFVGAFVGVFVGSVSNVGFEVTGAKVSLTGACVLGLLVRGLLVLGRRVGCGDGCFVGPVGGSNILSVGDVVSTGGLVATCTQPFSGSPVYPLLHLQTASFTQTVFALQGDVAA